MAGRKTGGSTANPSIKPRLTDTGEPQHLNLQYRFEAEDAESSQIQQHIGFQTAFAKSCGGRHFEKIVGIFAFRTD